MKQAPTLKNWILSLYDRAVDIVMIGLVLVMLVVLLFGFVDVLTNLIHLIPGFRTSGIDEPEFREMVANVLDVFIIVELFSIFTNYLRTRHVRLSTLLDVTIVFALRELLIKLYATTFSNEQLLGLCLIVLLLVICRSIAGRFSTASGHTQET
ncbi:phosphate-starvation-inducible PsiE family protein [Mangrovitalea sediminis]|uniref:phosphate-starvation-inducible PsiE family protein n=1 Tax=Mangrovitalea sediminis TaxID=1982043 RepID=UPI0018E90DE4|nr:phosphate-starvation-inducible PsiE family protein [Mangrovitalea sediminis]